MRYVKFGKTGMTVSELGFGCIPIIRLDVDTAVQVLRRAFDGMRKKVVLATKTLRRDAKGAAQHIENSLRMLRTDYIDLYQLHQIAQEKDWNAVTAPGGALEAVVRAREEGKIRWIGVTSHSLPMALKLVRTGLFSSIQFPFNFIEEAGKDELLPAARERGLGVLAMKPFAGGMINNAGVVFKFLRQYPEVLPIPGYDSVESVEEVVSIYRKPNVVTPEDLRLMDHYRAELGKEFCRRCEYCQPCPKGVMITMAMGYRIIASRMSPAVSVEFARPAMESVKLCDDCGICLERCPYELPIQDMLKLNYDLYEKHVADLR
jgi:hypothetical protein